MKIRIQNICKMPVNDKESLTNPQSGSTEPPSHRASILGFYVSLQCPVVTRILQSQFCESSLLLMSPISDFLSIEPFILLVSYKSSAALAYSRLSPIPILYREDPYCYSLDSSPLHHFNKHRNNFFFNVNQF